MSAPISLGRGDLKAMAAWIEPGSRVLDLGCGDGALLAYLKAEKGCHVQGVDIDAQNILSCAAQGLPVIQRDLNGSLEGFETQSYDVVVLSQTIHQVRQPDHLIAEILRIGRRGMVSFPNFGYWRLRLSLMLNGRMPKGDLLPYEWYETPNIHVLTLKDFEHFCLSNKVSIVRHVYLVEDGYIDQVPWPNLLSQGSVVLLEK
jgi:methionine biosynthesis protein MetW